MTSQEVKTIVENEIKGFEDFSIFPGIDLEKCLINPKLQKYKSGFKESGCFNLWTVLEETEDGEGYKIIYDEDNNSFGVGMKSDENELIYMGTYSAFFEVLKEM